MWTGSLGSKEACSGPSWPLGGPKRPTSVKWQQASSHQMWSWLSRCFGHLDTTLLIAGNSGDLQVYWCDCLRDRAFWVMCTLQSSPSVKSNCHVGWSKPDQLSQQENRWLLSRSCFQDRGSARMDSSSIVRTCLSSWDLRRLAILTVSKPSADGSFIKGVDHAFEVALVLLYRARGWRSMVLLKRAR